ncbi:MAG: septum formation protein Maf [Oscillospiraceae bacterium]|nr:septum formation protein Maf [Oscillospiraceae bacterium]
MNFNDVKVILASKSPRRNELLKYITDEFEVIPSSCDETVPNGLDVFEVPEFLSVRKALDVAKSHPDSLVIGCDTVVIINGEILGKPKDIADAFNMLCRLSGNTHTVVSGVCLCLRGKTMSFSQHTDVKFYPLKEEDIIKYLQSGSPLDKAGAYGIQDGAALFVESISGDYYNVVGFPIAKLRLEIEKFLNLFN